jgi:hypothetical protein
VAVTAINAERSHVVLMAERRRLRPHYARVSYIGRALKLNARPQHKREGKDPRVNRGPRNYVSAAMENLHRSDLAVRQDLLSVSHSTRDELRTKFAAGFLKLGIITAWSSLKMTFPESDQK